jgi:SAM-dependent methyltransferase
MIARQIAFFILFSLLLIPENAVLANHVPGATPQEKMPEVQTEFSIKELIRGSNIRSLRVSPRVFNANPADLSDGIHPTGSEDSDYNVLDLSTLDDKDPRWTTERKRFWKDIIQLLVDEAKQVEKHFPSVKANELLSWLTIFPDRPELPGYEISLSEIRDHQLLRYHLYSIALSKLADGKKGELLKKYLKELHPKQEPGIGSVAILTGVFARIDPTDKTATPRLTPDTATELYFAHQYADAIEQKYPERAGAIRRHVNRNHVIALVRGHQHGSFSGLAMSFPVRAFLDEFQKGASIDRGKLEGLLVDTLTAIGTHRYLLDDQGKKLSILWSLPDALANIESQLEEKDRWTFHVLRSKYGLDDATVKRFEAERLSSENQMKKGGRLVHLDTDSSKDVSDIPPWVPAFPSTAPVLKGGLPSPEELAQTANRDHVYVKWRGMADYALHLPKTFEKHFTKLTPQSRWLDVGSGEGNALHQNANRKLMEVRQAELRKILQDPNTLKEDRPFIEAVIQAYDRAKKLPQPRGMGVTLRMNRNPAPEEEGKNRYVVGRYVENIPAKELGSADLITDVVGAFAYANQIDKVLEKYLEVLAPGGTILIGTDVEKGKVKRTDGSVVDLYDWVASIPGLDVTIHRGSEDGPSLEIRVKAGSHPKVPRLDFFLGDDDAPPTRLYLEEKK